MQKVRQGLFHSLTLLTSFSTLICCALPALFVALGAGAVLAGIVSAVPQLVWLTEYKILLFGIAGSMLLLSGVLRYRSRYAPCPTDPAQAKACTQMRKISGIVYLVSVLIYVTGFIFAFIAPLWVT
jgi:hypothetical protein